MGRSSQLVHIEMTSGKCTTAVVLLQLIFSYAEIRQKQISVEGTLTFQ